MGFIQQKKLQLTAFAIFLTKLNYFGELPCTVKFFSEHTVTGGF